jgi:hypothetical protein
LAALGARWHGMVLSRYRGVALCAAKSIKGGTQPALCLVKSDLTGSWADKKLYRPYALGQGLALRPAGSRRCRFGGLKPTNSAYGGKRGRLAKPSALNVLENVLGPIGDFEAGTALGAQHRSRSRHQFTVSAYICGSVRPIRCQHYRSNHCFPAACPYRYHIHAHLDMHHQLTRLYSSTEFSPDERVRQLPMTAHTAYRHLSGLQASLGRSATDGDGYRSCRRECRLMAGVVEQPDGLVGEVHPQRGAEGHDGERR